jgi:acetolactate synthase-1/2/3 large subunit
MLNGAQALAKTLLDAGVDTCFNSYHTVTKPLDSAFAQEAGIRVVSSLFEGVASGAADGYARMTNKPAVMLSSYGYGFGNSQANLHNARKAKVPMINIIGCDSQNDSTLPSYARRQSDIESAVLNVSPCVRLSVNENELVKHTGEAVSIATGYPNQIASMIIPEDVSTSKAAETGVASTAVTPKKIPPTTQSDAIIYAAVEALKSGKECAIMVGGRALQEPYLSIVARISTKANAPLLSEVFPTRMQRGAGRPKVQRLAYLAEMAEVQLRGIEHLILIDTKAPVSFFAYPGKAGYLVPEGCTVHELVTPENDALKTLNEVCGKLGANEVQPSLQTLNKPKLPKGKLTGDKACDIIAALMPEDAIVSDESQTSGAKLMAKTAGCPKHDLLTLTGGAIGQGLPVAVGAAVACPDRPVIGLTGDGSAMYTIQSLSTMVQEQLDVTAIIFNNVSYSILNIELERVGVEGDAGPKAKSQLDLSGPNMDFVEIGRGMGIDSVRVETCDGFAQQLERALSTKGPHLIEVLIPPAITGLKLKVLPALLSSLKHLPRPIARAVKNALAP